jgi:hypothetical protein
MSRRTYPVPNVNLSGGDYIQNKRAKVLFTGTSDLARTIEEQNGNFPLSTPSGKVKPYQGTYGLSGRSSSLNEQSYCLNTSHSYRDLLAITKGKYLITPPNIADTSTILLTDVSRARKLYNGLYYVYNYPTTNALSYMNPGYPVTGGYPTTLGSYVANQIEYSPTSDANQRIITDPSYNITYTSQSCILNNREGIGISINNDYESKFSFNRTINLDLLTGFQYPVKFSLEYDSGDCINSNNDMQTKYALPSDSENIVAPVISSDISGNTLVGRILTTTDGTWSGSPAPTFTYRWYRGSNPIIPAAASTSHTYTITSADVGQSITCRVTGTNRVSSVDAISNFIRPTSIPINTAAHVISGPAIVVVGSTLTISGGTWTGFPVPTFDYQWYRGDILLSGKTANTYVTESADAGQSITSRVTGTNTFGSFVATSNSVTPIILPSNTSLPEISGKALVGSRLTSSSDGEWTGTPAPTFISQWYRGETPIPLASNKTYVTQPEDVGYLITYRVTGIHLYGSIVATSNFIIPATLPVNIFLPLIVGSSSIESRLICTPGTWDGFPAPEFSYQWYRGIIPISVTTNTYTISDLTEPITCSVTAKNVGGSVVATSIPIIPSELPVNRLSPAISTISGTPNAVGSRLACTDGSWTGIPAPTFTYQWYRGDNLIFLATNNTYVTQIADVEKSITCRVTGTNAVTSVVAPSDSITIRAVAPVNILAPVISYSGRHAVGTTYRCTDGIWTGIPAPTFTYQWYRETTLLSGKTNNTYVIETADISKIIRCHVTGTNVGGSNTAISNNPSPATINNQTYTPLYMYLVIDRYYGSSSSFFRLESYQEYDSATYTFYLNALIPGTNLVTIPSAGTRLIVEDMNYTSDSKRPDFYRFIATGSISDVGNGITQNFQVEQVTIVAPPVSIPPVNISSTPPVISGDALVGSTLTSTNGSWNGFPAPTFAYQWYRGGILLSGKTANTYVTQTDDIGQSITCRVIGANTSGSSFATSNTITPTPTPPVNTSLPIISTMTGGVTGVGSTLKTTNGSWDGIPAPTFTYQWYFKTTSVSNATPIPGETNDTYTIVTTSIAVEYTCRVTGTNVGGSSFATSNSLTIQ